MTEGTPAGGRDGTCFVVMGFGKKTDFESGRTLDLDLTYEYIIKPSVEAAGLKCIRADEIVRSGLIDVPMYEHLLTADVVIADLSTSNKNAYYELGVRHALRPHTTLIICEDGVKTFPFDTNHNLIRRYHHMETGIDFKEVLRFRDELTKAVKELLAAEPRRSDSPVYAFLNNLTPPVLASTTPGAAETRSASGETHRVLMQQVSNAIKVSDFVKAKSLLSTVREMIKDADPARPEDPYIVQQLAVATYKSNLPTPVRALEEARDLLKTLNPETSNDTETLGIWSAVHKRLWDMTQDIEHLHEAIRGCERGFYLRNDYYNGINFAFLLNVRAANTSARAESAASAEEATKLRAEAISCFIHAKEVRGRVISICQTLLEDNRLADKQKYWVRAAIAEAYLGIGDEAAAERNIQETIALSPANWMKDSTQKQMTELRRFLANSPLKYLETDSGVPL